MTVITAEQIKQIFKKVKHLRLPKNLENVEFSNLRYFGWADDGDKTCYLVKDYKGKLTGLHLDIMRLSQKQFERAFCEFCQKQRNRDEIMLVTGKTKRLPKGVNYRVRGNYICTEFQRCNFEMKNTDGVDRLFYLILEAN